MQLFAMEGGVVAVVGGFLGIALSVFATPLLARFVWLRYTIVALDATLDARVLGVAAAGTIFAILAAGVLPALRLSRLALQTGMAGAGRATGTLSGQRLTRTLVAAQLALSLLLVASAGLLLRTLVHVMSVDRGLNASNVLLMNIRDTEPAARFGEADSADQKKRRAAEYSLLDHRLNALPGMRAASLSWLGLFGGNYVGLNPYDEDHPESDHFTLLDYVSPRYFETVGMRLLRGRGFADTDREGALRVAVVNESFVRERIGGGREAISRRFVMTYADDRKPWAIVRIVRDAKYNDPGSARRSR